ncbi:MAG: cyclic nucleotide-binding domain-containing protein [Pseudomonadota bacterium]
MDSYQIAGFAGVAFYLGAYGALQFGLVRGNGYPYALLNLAAAALVLVSLFASWNLFSAIIQISWITLSVIGILRVWVLTQGLRFSAEEQDLLDAHFPTLRKIDARTIFRAGVWRDAQPGEALTEQTMPVTRLSYIHAGGVDIEVGDHKIADVGPGGFIGEMGCMASAPASATVRVNQPTRIFSVSSDALRRLVKRNPDLRPHLELAFSGNTRAKLMATNAKLEQSLRARAPVPQPSAFVSDAKPH